MPQYYNPKTGWYDVPDQPIRIVQEQNEENPDDFFNEILVCHGHLTSAVNALINAMRYADPANKNYVDEKMYQLDEMRSELSNFSKKLQQNNK